MSEKDRRDRQSRPTVPPIPREDGPPLLPATRRYEQLPLTEPIARIALKAPPPRSPQPSEHEEVMRALASLSSEREALAEERAAFEERMQESLRQIVIEEIPRHQTIPPHSDKERVSGSWFAHIPATLMGLAALVGVIAQSCSKKAEVSADVLAKIEAVDSHLAAHIAVSDQNKIDQKARDAALHVYLVQQHDWIANVLERQSVKVDDPEGAPARAKIDFYAPPARGSKAPLIQPNATFPYPP
jgi:hypothetical protein